MPAAADTRPPTRLYGLVPCAGTGERSGVDGPKQYAPIAGLPMVGHTLAALARVERLAAVMVVVAPGDIAFERHLPGFTGWVVRSGGKSRAETVARGLDALLDRGARASDWVLVHDAARCLVRPEWIDALIDAVQGDAIGGLLALPLADTLKTERDGRVVDTLDRRGKWQAQTPQMFRIGLLRDAYAAVGDGATDDAGAIEALGLAPLLVACSVENLKVTYPADFALAQRLLASHRPA